MCVCGGGGGGWVGVCFITAHCKGMHPLCAAVFYAYYLRSPVYTTLDRRTSKMGVLASWVCSPWMAGGQEMAYGRSILEICSLQRRRGWCSQRRWAVAEEADGRG
jgi:hypothetical protein